MSTALGGVRSGLGRGQAVSGPGMVPLAGEWGPGREVGERERRVAPKALSCLEPAANLGSAVAAVGQTPQLVRARSVLLPHRVCFILFQTLNWSKGKTG